MYIGSCWEDERWEVKGERDDGGLGFWGKSKKMKGEEKRREFREFWELRGFLTE